jgi:hypothetical protein
MDWLTNIGCTMPTGFDFFGGFAFRGRRPGPMRPKAKSFKGSKAAKRAHRHHK